MFLHAYIPTPIAFQSNFITVRWYGLILALALVSCVAVLIYLAKRSDKLKSDEVYDLAFALAICGIIGARLYDVFVIYWDYYKLHPVEIFKIWEGGLAIHGAILGGGIGLWLWCKVKKKDFWGVADLVAVVLPLGQAIGRWGNYFNQENFGRPMDLAWGIPIDPANRSVGFESFNYFHPTFLYESILNLALFGVLFFVFSPPRFIRGRLGGGIRDGSFAAIYLIGYALIRFFMEFIRIDTTPLIWGMRFPQLVSLAVLAAGVVLAYFVIRRSRGNN